MSGKKRTVTKDMYWFAHGGLESLSDTNKNQRNAGEEDENELNSHMGKNISDRRGINEEQKSSSYSRDISLTDGSNSSGPSSLERDDRLHGIDKRTAVEERRKLLWEAEQERNDAVMRKHMEREAALEARRNAQRSNISFAFGSSVPRNVDTLQVNQAGDSDIMSRSFTAGGSSQKAENHSNFHDRRSLSPFNSSRHGLLDGISHRPDSSLSSHSEKKIHLQSSCLVGSGALFGEDLMSRSMTASTSAPRGRRKNDLMPTVPYERTPVLRVATSSSSRRRSVSMTRLDQLAQPRKHYVEATKANSTASNGGSNLLKGVCSPNRPLSSASEQSGGRVSTNVTRRVRSSPRKPRPVSIAGTIPDQKLSVSVKSHEIKAAPIKRTYTPMKKSDSSEVKKMTPKSTEKVKTAPRPSTAPVQPSAPKSSTQKQNISKVAPKSKKPEPKPKTEKPTSTQKTQSSKSALTTNKRKVDMLNSSPPNEIKDKLDPEEKVGSPPPEIDASLESEKSGKRIISEEEAKAALAEKRRLAREQAEKEAELERLKMEELQRLEEERLRQEEEEQRKMEEEQLRLLEEHRRQEEEKLRKAIEDQEHKEEEERAKRDEELRLKAEQEKKAKEEAEKLRLELEEKLRKEEEERAERKKRLEKIMSRTRGRSSGTSPSGSISGSDQMDSGDNQQEGFSSGANSLESNDGREPASELLSSDDAMAKMEVSSGGNSLEANHTYEFGSNDVSLNSNDLMLPASETTSQENSIVLDKETPTEGAVEVESTGTVTPINSSETKSQLLTNTLETNDETKDLVSESIVELESQVKDEFVEDNSEQKLNENAKQVPSINSVSFMEEASEHNDHQEYNKIEVEKKSDASSDIALKGSDENSSEINDTSVVESHSQNPVDSDVIPMSSEVGVSDSSDYLQEKEVTQNEDINKKDLNVHFDDSKNSYIDIKTEFSESSLSSNNSLQNSNSYDCSDEVDANSKDISFLTQEAIGEKSDQDLNCSDVDPNMSHNPFFDVETIPMTDEKSSLFGENQNKTSFTNSVIYDNTFEMPQDINEEQQITKDEIIFQHSNGINADIFLEKTDFLNDVEKSSQNILSEEKHLLEEKTSFNSVSGFDNQNFTKDVPAYEIGDTSDLCPPHLTDLEKVEKTESSNTEASEVHMAGDNPFITESSNTEASEVHMAGDNPFITESSFHSKNDMFQSQFGDYNVQEHKILENENMDFQNQTLDQSSHFSVNEKLDNVTLITQEGSENYVGIISSIDNDQLSNSFSNFHKPLTNNFECSSTTESEDSSLDSNLSQVIANEDSDIKVAESPYVNNVSVLNSNNLTSNNVEHSDDSFKKDSVLNQSSIPHSSTNHFSEPEIYHNGHSVESSKIIADHHSDLHDFVQLDGSNILDVDHSKNNIFENVDVMAYGKVSSDAFLVKGNSNPMSGNPFLLQDEQKQVLMTSDFLN